MRKYLWIIGLIIAFFTVFIGLKYAKLEKSYNLAVLNNKAYESLLNMVNEENKAFQFTIDQLKYINDNSIRLMDSLRRELGIKDKKLKLMGKIKEYVYITDSITIHDTIFRDPEFKLDTCLGDEWYHNHLHLEYPNRISSTIDINTDLNVLLYTTRETVNPPKKTWIGRLFQRKHDVYNVTVIESNPYVLIKENKFVIIK